jgi:hypothetical protein
MDHPKHCLARTVKRRNLYPHFLHEEQEVFLPFSHFPPLNNFSIALITAEKELLKNPS